MVVRSTPTPLHRYLAEFDFRYNRRSVVGVEDNERHAMLLAAIHGKRLTYRRIGEARLAQAEDQTSQENCEEAERETPAWLEPAGAYDRRGQLVNRLPESERNENTEKGHRRYELLVEAINASEGAIRDD